MAENDAASSWINSAGGALLAIGTSVFGVVGYLIAMGLNELAVTRCSIERMKQPWVSHEYGNITAALQEHSNCGALLKVPVLGPIYDVKAAGGIIGIGLALGVLVIAGIAKAKNN
ncbi:hypothetical protein J7F03_30250 [Streptomyces sp. ISL-43]|uniref:hypothetical protein n=1 Tax=Streptomyces sp. ISL-43 TaxID=2819183 RepID=UPI001BED0DC4|nr:hypothetical protein [Streptomyces sp. ISL-43]MBT2451276.1 hypothetical protein [Streptomyces sp. ISL-43]